MKSKDKTKDTGLTEVEFTTVWDRTIPYLTSTDLDPDLADRMGFAIYAPKNEKEVFPEQNYIERPDKKHLILFKEALKANGVKAKIIPYSVDQSDILGWDEWCGYKWGVMANEEMQAIVTDLIKNDPHLLHLSAVAIKCVFIKGKPTKNENGRYELVTVQCGQKAVKQLRKFDFILACASIVWDCLTDVIKERITLHSLLHCYMKGGPSMVMHDIEEFTYLLTKYGLNLGDDPYNGAQELVDLAVQQEKDDIED